jgi:hemolysin III
MEPGVPAEYMRPGLSKDGSVHVTDEVYNTLISGLGAVLTLFGVAHLLWRSYAIGSLLHALSFLVYGVGVLSVFVSSALHHGVDGSPRTNWILRQLDYFAIFLMIAGTFTPFCLLFVRSPLGVHVLELVWALAAVSIASKAIYPALPKWVTLAMALGMGWSGLLLVDALYASTHLSGVVALALGGLFFTGGGLIFALEKPNPFPGRFGFHEIWHSCVLAGAACHFSIMYAAF